MNHVLIIAEAGVNHNGSIELAKELIDIAAEAKVDFVKFQTWITEDIIAKGAPKAEYQVKNDGDDSQYEMAKRLELSWNDFKELKQYCDQKGVNFLSTAEEFKSLDFLVDDLKIPLIKIGSGELNNTLFLREVGAKRLPVILSTGMATMEEVEIAYKTLKEAGAKEITVLHCTTNYPTAYEEVNLKAMLTIKDKLKVPVGYSDHTLGIEVPVAAVSLGAVVIEKHYTIDKNLPGPDHKASLDPIELKNMVTQIRNIEMAISGDGRKEPTESEIRIRPNIRKGLYLARDVIAGEVLTKYHFNFKRPVKDIPVDEADFVLGKKVLRDLPKDHALEKKDLDV
ncbi:MAG: N-acetylneuraminate synthase [Bacteriovoracaceae bacterium]